MAEYNIAENLESESLDEYSTDVMTGDRNKRMYLYHQLANSLRKAENVDIIVSFLMESGVRLLLNDLENALKRGAKIRILTGNYLGITQPSALYLIKIRTARFILNHIYFIIRNIAKYILVRQIYQKVL